MTTGEPSTSAAGDRVMIWAVRHIGGPKAGGRRRAGSRRFESFAHGGNLMTNIRDIRTILTAPSGINLVVVKVETGPTYVGAVPSLIDLPSLANN